MVAPSGRMWGNHPGARATAHTAHRPACGTLPSFVSGPLVANHPGVRVHTLLAAPLVKRRTPRMRPGCWPPPDWG